MFDFKLTKENILKWSISLGLLLFILFIFPVANLYVDGTKQFALSGYNIVFGVEFGKMVSNESILRPSLFLIIGFIGFELCALANFVNLKKFEFIKKFLTIFFGSILLITLLSYTNRYNTNTLTNVLFEFNIFGKIVVMLVGVLVLLSIIVYFKNNQEVSEIKTDTLNIISVALGCLMLLTLFNTYGFVKNSSYTIEMNGIIAMFGKHLDTKTFSLNDIPSNIFALFGYIGICLLIIGSVVNVFIKNKIVKYINLFISGFVFIFLVNIDIVTLNITQVAYSSTVYTSLTELGVFASLLGLYLFVMNVIEFIKNNSKENIIKVVMFMLIFFSFSSLYIPSYKLYKHYTSSDNYITYITILDILKGSIELNTNFTYTTTYPAKLILGLILGGVGSVICIIPVKPAKIKYLIGSGFMIGGSLVMLLAKDGLLRQLVEEVSTYDTFVYVNGTYLVIGCLLLASFIAMYFAATSKKLSFTPAKKA